MSARSCGVRLPCAATGTAAGRTTSSMASNTAARIRIRPPLLLTAAGAPAPVCRRRWLDIDARRGERAGLELPALRRLHVLVVVAPAERDPSGIAVLADVDDHGVLFSDGAPG